MSDTCKNCGNLENGSIIKVTEKGCCFLCDRKVGGEITFGEFPISQRNTYIKNLKDFYAKNIEISERKSSDYASDEDPLSNFREAETMGLTVEQGILLRMGDKWSRLKELLGKGKETQVKDEKIEDTLRDMANYAAILYTYLQSKVGYVGLNNNTPCWECMRIVKSGGIVQTHGCCSLHG